MKVVILGAGRRGNRLAKSLVEEQYNVILMDHNSSCVSNALTSVDCLAVQCNGTDIDDLAQAGVADADAFIALTGSDEINLVSCGIVSSHFKVPVTIASVRSLSYTNTDSLMGISHIVNPYQEVAKHIWREIDKGIYSDMVMFEHSALLMNKIHVDDNSPYVNKTLKEMRKSTSGNFVIVAISRGDEAIVPSGETVIEAGDTLAVISDDETLENVFMTKTLFTQKAKKICVFGGTMITEFLLHNLNKQQRKSTTVLIKDPERALEISAMYPDVLTIQESSINEMLFIQENLMSNDVMVCITDNDELNLITASYAKTMGVKNSMALLIKNPDYISMMSHLGINSLISSQDVTVDSIIKYLHGKNISSVHRLFDGKLETFEFRVPSDSSLIGKRLMDINMRGKGIIAGVTNLKDNTNIIPTGTYTIKHDDVLVLVILSKANQLIQNILSTGKGI